MSASGTPRPWFSADALQQLQVAVDQRLAGRADDPQEGLVDACRRLRTEAHAANLGFADSMKAVRDASLATCVSGWDKPLDVRYYRLLDDCLTIFLEVTGEMPAADRSPGGKSARGRRLTAAEPAAPSISPSA